jgi:hypothetical protein
MCGRSGATKTRDQKSIVKLHGRTRGKLQHDSFAAGDPRHGRMKRGEGEAEACKMRSEPRRHEDSGARIARNDAKSANHDLGKRERQGVAGAPHF